MIQGKLKSGFAYQIDEAALDDWDLMEDLAKADEGNVSGVISAVKRMLGDEQFKALKDHLRGENGRLKMTDMFSAFKEIMTVSPEVKNS